MKIIADRDRRIAGFRPGKTIGDGVRLTTGFYIRNKSVVAFDRIVRLIQRRESAHFIGVSPIGTLTVLLPGSVTAEMAPVRVECAKCRRMHYGYTNGGPGGLFCPYCGHRSEWGAVA